MIFRKKSDKNNIPKRVAIVGSQGVPAKYGGFESLVENIIRRNKTSKIKYTVFCSAPDMGTSLSIYKNAVLKYVRLRAHGIMSVPYDIISMIKAARHHDTILMLGVSGGVFVPILKLFSTRRIIVNIDGLEHNRDKWNNNTLARKYLKFSLGACIKWADEIVSDNRGIQNYVLSHYGRNPKLIAYGGDHAIRHINNSRQTAILNFYGLIPQGYDLAICRIEPENNVDLTLQAAEKSNRPLVFIGNWNNSDYSLALYKKYRHIEGFHLIQATYDLDILYAIRNNARYYIHGHRAGGTNPSLVEAMFFGMPILSFDVIYNRETTEGKAYYFKDVDTLADLLATDGLDGRPMIEIAHREYVWKTIARQYEDIY